MRRLEPIERFLIEAFDVLELRRFLESVDPEVRHHLPPSAPPFELAEKGLAWLDRRGLLDERFFTHLSEARPNRRGEIQRLSGAPPRSRLRYSLPHARDDGFIGRALELASLAEYLHGHARARVQVRGLAGIGKSHLLLQSVHAHLDRYRTILWIDASAGGHPLEQRLLDTAHKAGIPLPDCSDRLDALRRILEEEDDLPNLIVLDNLEEREGWARLLPRLGDTRVAATSWRTDLDGFRALDLDIMPRLDALALLGHAPARDNPGAATALAEELGWHTLALSVASRVLQRQGREDPGRLLEEIRARGLVAWSASAPSDPVYEKSPSIAALFEVVRRHLDPEEPTDRMADRLLQRAGWLAPVEIPPELLEYTLRGADSDVITRDEIDAARYRLFDLGLATDAAGGLLLQRVVAAWARTLDDGRAAEKAAARAIATLIETMPRGNAGLLVLARAREHLAEVRQRALAPELRHLLTACIANTHIVEGEPALALALAEAALREARSLGNDLLMLWHRTRAVSLVELGRAEDAERTAAEGVEEVEAVTGQPATDLRALLAWLQSVNQNGEDPVEALQAIHASAGDSGREGLLGGVTALWLTGALLAADRHGEALAMIQIALAGFAREVGPDTSETGLALRARALIQGATGDTEGALMSFQAAIDCLVRTVGPGHHETARTEGMRADLLLRHGRFEDARRAYRAGIRRAQGAGSVSRHIRGDLLADLAAAALLAGDLPEARATAEEAIRLVTDMRDTRSLGKARMIQAQVWARAGDSDRAIEAYQALIVDSIRPADLLPALLGLGELLLVQGRHAEAANCLARARALPAPRRPDDAHTFQLAVLRALVEPSSEALLELRAVRAAAAHAQGPMSLASLLAGAVLAQLVVSLEDPTEAFRLTQSLLEPITNRFGAASPIATLVRGTAVQALYKLGRPAEALADARLLLAEAIAREGPVSDAVVQAAEQLAYVTASAGDPTQAARLLGDTLVAVERAHGLAHATARRVGIALARMAKGAGQHHDAIAVAERLLSAQPSGVAERAECEELLADLHLAGGDRDTAEEHARNALSILAGLDNAPEASGILETVAWLVRSGGGDPELLACVHVLLARGDVPTPPKRMASVEALVQSLATRGRVDDAASLAQAWQTTCARREGPDSLATLVACVLLCQIERLPGRTAIPARTIRGWMRRAAIRLGAEHPVAIGLAIEEAVSRGRAGQDAAAVRTLRGLLTSERVRDQPFLAMQIHLHLGHLQLVASQSAMAIACLRSALEHHRRAEAGDLWEYELRMKLAGALADSGDYGPALDELQRVEQLSARVFGGDEPRAQYIVAIRGSFLARSGDTRGGIGLLGSALKHLKHHPRFGPTVRNELQRWKAAERASRRQPPHIYPTRSRK